MKESNRLLFGFALVVCATNAEAESFQFGSERHCISSGRVPADVCANAATNAAAEFEEKAPRFPSRQTCEKTFPGGCAVGFRGEAGFKGRRDAVFFSPRQSGFRIVVRSEHDIRVSPSGPDFGFSSRSALTRDATIRPHGSREFHADSPLGAGHATSAFGVATPEGPKGVVPARPPIDPNFDCASVLEPGSDASTGCALAPVRRR